MKRNLDLSRKIMFAIEDQYKPGTSMIFNLQIEGYDILTVAEHCDLLYQQDFIAEYKPQCGGGKIQAFFVGNLTNAGYDYLEHIRDEKTWQKIKDQMQEKKLPQTIEMVARVAGIFAGQAFKEISS